MKKKKVLMCHLYTKINKKEEESLVSFNKNQPRGYKTARS